MVTYLKFKMQFAISQRKTERKHFLKRKKQLNMIVQIRALSVITKRFPIHFQCIKLSCSAAPFKN